MAVADTKQSTANELPGKTAFLLHDTYGFPIELTLEMAEEAGISVDRGAFDQLMSEQRNRAKADAKSKKKALADLSVYSEFRAQGETTFLGYTELEAHTRVLGLLKDGLPVQSAQPGDTVEVILAETTLYAESGGQSADAGAILGDGSELRVIDVQKPVKGLVSHTAEVTRGVIAVGDAVTTVVDVEYRRGASQAHSATHLVHAALREVLGPQAHQAGSFNKSGYLRLDFSWSNPLSSETRSEIEEIANNAISANYEVVTRELPIAEAKAAGAMALFGEKYGDVVRMVDIGGPWSRELCAGTHVSASGQVGLINLVSESSVGSTARRIESLVGLDAFREFAAERALVNQLSSSLKTPRDKLAERIEELSSQLRAAEKTIAGFEAAAIAGRVPALVQLAERRGGFHVVVENVGEVASADDARQLAIGVRDKLGSEPSVVAILAIANAKPVAIVATNQAARDLGANAGALAKRAAGILGGGGGGKPDLAQGGGSDIGAMDAAISALREEVAS